MRNVSTKRAASVILAIMVLMSLSACSNTAGDSPSDVPAPMEATTTVNAGKDTPCTGEEIATAMSVGGLLFDGQLCEYLVTHQNLLPADVLTCLNEHIGEYKMVKLAENSGETEFSEENTVTVAAVLQLHGYTPQMLTAADSAALSQEELAAKVAENAKYMVNGNTAYLKPEDGADFLPYFATFEPEVLDTALGVTLSAPKEITDRTTYNSDIALGTSLTRCALITNNSDKRVQLIPAGDLTDAEWKAECPDYDPSLVIDWNSERGTKNPDTQLIPLGAAAWLEPGESTVVRYSYVGHENEDLDFISRFSYYVTDGESTELLAGAVLNHIRPSEFPEGYCTVSGTVYDAETGLPVPFIDVQASRNRNFATTDTEGRFTIDVPAFRYDATGNWARSTIFFNELGLLGDSAVNDAYAQESIIVEPRTGESMELTIALKKNPAQVNYTLQTEHDMKMQAYCVDSSHDIVVTSPFHTTFSEEYKYENGYLHVFDKTGALLFEKPLYGESAFCDISTDGKLIASIVHGKQNGDPDTAVIWDINGNEVFSYQVPYKENPALYVQPEEGHNESVFSKLGDLEISNDGKTLFWGTDSDSTNERSMFIDMETGTPLWGTLGGKQAAAFSADDRYVALRSGGNLQLWTTTGEHRYGALIALDDNSMSWGIYMGGDCKYIISFAGGSVEGRHYGVMYALTLDESTPLE